MGSNAPRPSERLQQANEVVGDAFQAFREAARHSGPLDRATIELILIAGFASGGHEEPFKNHVRRSLHAGVTKEALQQVVYVTLGATAVLAAVANALRWIDEVESARREGEA